MNSLQKGKILGISGWGCDVHAYKDIIWWSLQGMEWQPAAIYTPEQFLASWDSTTGPNGLSIDIAPPKVMKFIKAEEKTVQNEQESKRLASLKSFVNSPPYILFAWSLGSLIALRMALQRPDAIAGMILLSPTARMTRDGDYPGVAVRVLRQMRRRFDENPLAVLTDFHRKSWFPLDDEGRALELARRVMDGKSKPGLAAGLDYLASEDLRDEVPKIICPVLILHGDADAIIDPACGQWLADRLPDCRFELLRGHGHMLPQTSFNACAIPIRKFFDERLR